MLGCNSFDYFDQTRVSKH